MIFIKNTPIAYFLKLICNGGAGIAQPEPVELRLLGVVGVPGMTCARWYVERNLALPGGIGSAGCALGHTPVALWAARFAGDFRGHQAGDRHPEQNPPDNPHGSPPFEAWLFLYAR